MKTLIFILAVLILPIAAMGQNTQVDEVKVSPPVFTGQYVVPGTPGIHNSLLDDYVARNFQYPDDYLRCDDQGTVVVQFVVQPDGSLTDFEIVNSICPDIDQEFVRVIRETEGMWRPAFHDGEAIERSTEACVMIVTDCQLCDNKPTQYLTKLAQSKFKMGNRLFLEKEKPERALRYYDACVKYMPYDHASLMVRGLCRYALGDKEGASSDWTRINEIGLEGATSWQNSLNELEGFAEMQKILEK